MTFSRSLRGPAIFLGGLALALAAWGRVIATPGEMIQADLTYAIHSDLLPRMLYPAWDQNRHSVLISVGEFGTHAPFFVAGLLGGLSSAAIMKSLVVGWVVLGYAMAWHGFCLFLGYSRDARRATAPESLGLAFGSVFWVLNPWFLSRLETFGIGLSALGLPLAVGLMWHSIRSNRPLAAAGSGLVTVLISMGSPHYIVTTFVVLGILWVVCFVQRASDRTTILKIGIAYVIVVAGAGAFVWLPSLSTVIAGGQFQPSYVYTGTQIKISADTQTLWNSVTLTAHQFFGVTSRPTGIHSVAWSVASLLGASSLALAVVFDRLRRPTWIFAGTVAGAFLALLSLSSLPSGSQPYENIVQSVPLGWLLREPDKVGGPIPLFYALGIAWMVPAAIGLPGKRVWPFRRGISVLAIAVITGLLFVWMRPSIERSLLRTDTVSYIPVEFPREYYEFTDRFMPKSDPNASVLIFHQPAREPSWSRNHIVWGVLHGSTRARVLSDTAFPIDNLAKRALADPRRFTETLLEAGVGAVALAVDDDAGRRLADKIASFPGVRERNVGILIRRFDLIGVPAPLVEVGGREPRWQRPAPTRYEIQLEGSRESGRFVLRELADLQWRATFNGKPLERSPDPLFNAWELPASESGVATVTYEMQKYLVIGYVIAGLTVIGFVAAAIPLRRVARGFRT